MGPQAFHTSVDTTLHVAAGVDGQTLMRPRSSTDQFWNQLIVL